MENTHVEQCASKVVNVTVRSARPREYLTEREIDKLIEAAKGNRWGHRDATAILLAYRHGLRASELAALRWDDIDFRTSKLHVRRAKGGTASVQDWQAHGAEAIIAMREQSPSKYCALVAALIPQHFKVEHDHTLMMNEDELRARLLEIRAKLLDSMLTRTCSDRRPKRMRDSGWRSWWALRCWRFVPSALPTIESFTPRQTRHIIFFFTVHQDY